MADVILDAYLRDTTTGRAVVFSHPCATEHLDGMGFLWGDGNLACDCNRSDFLYRVLGEDVPAGKFSCATGLIACDRVVRRDTGEVLYEGDAAYRG